VSPFREIEPSARPAGRAWLSVLVGYVLLAVLTIGRHALSHPTTVCACVGNGDPAFYMWALNWWPHAIVHAQNPFFTHVIWSPAGLNVAQAAGIPTAAILMAPITAAIGPIASYNVLSVASPALAAFTAYLLCRRLVVRRLPAVVGGYIFGFSPYEFAQLTGHVNLTLTFLIPVMILAALKRVRSEISTRVYLATMALVFVLQAGLSTELLAECVGFGFVVLLGARFLSSPAERGRIDRLIVETVGAGLIALVVASPFFYYALFSGGLPPGNAAFWDQYAMDLLNPFVPTSVTSFGHHAVHSISATFGGGGVTGEDGYVGIPLLAAFLAWGFGVDRRRALNRIVVIVAALSVVAALGAHLHIGGKSTISLPFGWIDRLPIVDGIIPERISLFTSLAVAVGIAAWLDRSTGRAVIRWIVAVIACVMLFPSTPDLYFGERPTNPAFFKDSLYTDYLTRGESALMLPFGYNDASMLWQAETHFYFSMPEGYAGQEVPAPFSSDPVVAALLANAPPPTPAFGSFIRAHHVQDVIVDAAAAGPWPAALVALGFRARFVGGVILYKVPPISPPRTVVRG
jgi:hypothetical protein